MEQRHHHTERERDELYDKFESTIYDVQQKAGFKNILLERKLTAINESLEKKEAQLSEVRTDLEAAKQTRMKTHGNSCASE